MNDNVLEKYADCVDEYIIEKYLQFEKRLKTISKFRLFSNNKIAVAVCAFLIISCMTIVGVASSGYFVLVDLAEIFEYERIEYITITGGPLDSIGARIDNEDDLKRFCEMFDFKYDLFLTVKPKVSTEEPDNKDNLELSRGCAVLIDYKDSSDNVLLIVNSDNTFVLMIDGETYVCEKKNILDYHKIKYFR